MTTKESVHAIQQFALLRNAEYAKENIYKKYGVDHRGKAKGYTYTRHTFKLPSLLVQVARPNKEPINRAYTNVVVSIDDGDVIVKFRDEFTINSVHLSLFNLIAQCQDIDLRLQQEHTIVVLK